MFIPIHYKDIKNTYSINEHGDILNILTNKILAQKTTKKNYKEISLYTNQNKLKTVRVHILVALHFCEGYDSNTRNEVNHKDFNKSNNYYENLEWVTHEENLEHARIHGMLSYKGEKNPSSKYSDEYIESICKLLESGNNYDDIINILHLDSTEKTRKLLRKIKNREIYTHISIKYSFDSFEPMVKRNSEFKEYYSMIKSLMKEGYSDDEIFQKFNWNKYHGREREKRRDFIRNYRKKFIKYNCEGSTTIENEDNDYYNIIIT